MKILLYLSLLLLPALRAAAQAPHYKVYAIRFAAELHPMALSGWVAGGPEKDSVTLDFMIWLIKGDNGKNILLDAGFRRDAPEAKYFEPYSYMQPDSALARLNLQPGDITDIIVSHPHWDHIDGLSLFPNAHIWMQKEDYGYFVGGAWQKDGQPGGFEKRDVRTLLDLNMAGKLTLVDGDDKEILPGIRVYTGSRHTWNSQFVVVQTGARKVLLASDNLWVYYSLEHMMPPPKGGTFDPAGFVRSMRRMKTLVEDPKYIIPGHDARVLSIFPEVAEGVVEIK
ncbi:MAG TPA: N-acyl homoserine lactonase family protein [Puia sp.]|jgi:glyoxylase-like metal-dependent hydrolase (beta-lactamase superfamily II)|nr:N-acyl homoserine lactonase family protein [Puia sp.]